MAMGFYGREKYALKSLAVASTIKSDVARVECIANVTEFCFELVQALTWKVWPSELGQCHGR